MSKTSKFLKAKRNFKYKFEKLFSYFNKGFKTIKNKSLDESGNDLDNHINADGVHKEEQNIINNMVEFSDLEASDIMINRKDIVAADSHLSFNELKKIFLNEDHSRMPIYKTNLDDILGFIHIKDVFKVSSANAGSKTKITELIRNIIFIPQSIKLTELLSKMKASQIHIAIVLDEHAGTAGLITIEDIMEELVGDIQDEYDQNEIVNLIQKDGDCYRIDTSAKLEDVENTLNISLVENIDDVEYDTLGGFIITYLGSIPKVGYKFRHPTLGIEFEILDATSRRLKQVKISFAQLKE